MRCWKIESNEGIRLTIFLSIFPPPLSSSSPSSARSWPSSSFADLMIWRERTLRCGGDPSGREEKKGNNIYVDKPMETTTHLE